MVMLLIVIAGIIVGWMLEEHTGIAFWVDWSYKEECRLGLGLALVITLACSGCYCSRNMFISIILYVLTVSEATVLNLMFLPTLNDKEVAFEFYVLLFAVFFAMDQYIRQTKNPSFGTCDAFTYLMLYQVLCLVF